MLIRETRDIEQLEWEKMSGLLPAIVQDSFDGRVLMQGYMNREALAHTLRSGEVTFWSRSRQTLWTKGETSGHTLRLVAGDVAEVLGLRRDAQLDAAQPGAVVFVGLLRHCVHRDGVGVEPDQAEPACLVQRGGLHLAE